MHDPLEVAFQIRRPWPKRVDWHDRRWYWPSLITIWHREPRGHNSGTVCRVQDAQGRQQYRMRQAWRFHLHHWQVQIHPLQRLRRWLLTRCAGCGGRHRRHHPVSSSLNWDPPRSRWWQGEQCLYHHECMPSPRGDRESLTVV